MNDLVKGHIVFDHDGTLVQVNKGSIQLFAGMEEFLRELKSQNFALYLWTARPRASAIEILTQFNIMNYFDNIYCVGDGPSKPHPKGLEVLTNGIDKKKITHIGDSFSDIEGAQSFGIDVIAACWNDTSYALDFKEETPYVALTIDECREIIRGKYV